MGRKVHPIGFRIGITRDWQAKWHADKHYREFLHEDIKLRQAILSRYSDTSISLVEIERQSNKVSVTIHTARPGIVIGRGGQRVDETRRYLEDLLGKRIQLNIQEIRQPELDAYLVARTVAEQIQRRIAYRRALKQALFRTMQAGAKGMKVRCAGRLGGAEIARREVMHRGQVPLHTLRADIDYGFTEAHTPLGRIGIKVWINRGEILPELEEPAVEEAQAEPVASTAAKAAPPVAEAPEVKAAEPTTGKAEVPEVKAAVPTTGKTEVPEVKAAVPKAKKAAVKKPAAEKAEVKAAKPKAKKPVARKQTAEKAEVKPAVPKAKKAAVKKPAAEKAEVKPAVPKAKKAAVKKPAAEKAEVKAAKPKAKKPVARKQTAEKAEVKTAKPKAKKTAVKKEETDAPAETG